MSFDFIFYWFSIQTRKNVEKVVYIKPKADVYCIIKVVTVVIMNNK
jgi:hypothetical protein